MIVGDQNPYLFLRGSRGSAHNIVPKRTMIPSPPHASKHSPLEPTETIGSCHSGENATHRKIELNYTEVNLFMNETTKVVRFHRTGGPEVLRIEEIRRPKPKGSEVLVRVQAEALSRPDLVWREGSYFEEPLFPAQIGHDAAGVVESVGPEVKNLKVGDHVSTFPAVSLLDYAAHGENIVYPETALHVYPMVLTPVQAAAVNTGLFTAYF